MSVTIAKPCALSNTQLPKSEIPIISFGEVMRSIRVCQDLLPATFAKKLGITLSELQLIENGSKKVSENEAKIFAQKLNADPQILLTPLNR